MEPTAKFCPKCGKPAGAASALSATTATPAAQSSNAVKIILIVVAAIIAVGVIGTVAAGFIGLGIARRTHVEQKDGRVRVQTPFGTVETSQDADDAARNLGVPIYPGARATKGNSANVNVGGMHTTTVQFESDDPADKVAQFYRSKFPDANVNTAEGDHYTIVSTQNKNVVTINIEPDGDKTRIDIASVMGKGAGQASSE